MNLKRCQEYKTKTPRINSLRIGKVQEGPDRKGENPLIQILHNPRIAQLKSKITSILYFTLVQSRMKYGIVWGGLNISLNSILTL